ncbi:Laccase [Bertholletia excelsa]
MARSEDHFYDFFLVEKTYWRICNHTSILTVNGSFPGPTLRVRKGDTAFVNVHNHGTYGVTIHWHGVKQPRNPWSDGPDFITQCQISPGTNHTYKVIFSTEEGTLWWHAHSDWTQSTVYGAIHILPAEGTTYPFPEPDGEHDIILGSWYNYDVNKKLHYDLYVGADLPSPNAFLINGQPGAYFNCSAEEMHRIIVDYGKTYLLRIINAALNSEFFFAIAGHNLTVVGMDGSYLKPFITKYLVISPGQTMNVLLATNQNPSHYYIAGRQFVSAGNIENEEPTAAVLEYIGKYTPPSSPVFPSSLPVFRDIRAANAFWARLRSLASKEHSVSVPKHVDHPMFIVVSEKIIACPNRSCDSDNGNRISSSMNNITFQNPIANILLAYYRNISGVYTPDFPDFPEVFMTSQILICLTIILYHP